MTQMSAKASELYAYATFNETVCKITVSSLSLYNYCHYSHILKILRDKILSRFLSQNKNANVPTRTLP